MSDILSKPRPRALSAGATLFPPLGLLCLTSGAGGMREASESGSGAAQAEAGR